MTQYSKNTFSIIDRALWIKHLDVVVFFNQLYFKIYTNDSMRYIEYITVSLLLISLWSWIYITPFMFCTVHTRISGLNRDKHTLQYTRQTISCDFVQQPQFSSSIYTTVHVNEKKIQEQNYLMEFHSRQPNSHGFSSSWMLLCSICCTIPTSITGN